MKVRMTATGTRPLIVHNVQLASPLNAYAKRLKALNSKRVKTEEDRLDIARVEFEGSLYYDDTLGPYLPGPNLFASLIGGARLTRAGKKVERGLVVSDFMLPLIYRGPRDIEGLWAAGGSTEFVDLRSVVVQRQKVDRCRPIFRTWAVESELIVDPKVLELDELREIAKNAGQMEGVGDYRRAYGRYDVEIEQL